MHEPQDFSNLQFDRHIRFVSGRLAAVIAGVIGFSLIWVILPAAARFWVLLPLAAGLAWAASYGWREALNGLIEFLERLAQS